MARPKHEPPRGVLSQAKGTKHFQLSRYHPRPELTQFVEHFWIVQWELGEEKSYQQNILAHPSVPLVFERGRIHIWGVVTGKFTRTLEGRGKALGVKFRAGGFFPFYGKPLSAFQDQQLAFPEVFDEDPAVLEAAILNPKEDQKMAEQTELFLINHLPPSDPKIAEVSGMVDRIQHDTSILKVDEPGGKSDRQ